MTTPQSVEPLYRIRAQAMPQWYLICTKPLAEMTAQRQLERQGFATYLPRLVQVVRRRERWVETIGPLFPRYLFLQLEPGRQSLRPAHSTVGVSHVVRFGTRCAVVPDDILAELRSRADPLTGLHRLRARRGLTPGAAVRIAAGPFEGLEAVFERRAGTDRVVVLLKLLGQDASLCVSEESIRLCHV
jgi:transcriptional antiterminator RfaH